MKYENFTPAETKILDKVRELRNLMLEYYPNNKHTSLAIIEKEDCTYISINSDWKGEETELDVTVWDKKGE